MVQKGLIRGNRLGLGLLVAAQEMSAGRGKLAHFPEVSEDQALGVFRLDIAKLLGRLVWSLKGCARGPLKLKGAAMSDFRLAERYPHLRRNWLAA